MHRIPWQQMKVVMLNLCDNLTSGNNKQKTDFSSLTMFGLT